MKKEKIAILALSMGSGGAEKVISLLLPRLAELFSVTLILFTKNDHFNIPEEINVVVSLPTNPKNTNKDITKLLYNDDKLFKALSDIGFGEISEDIRKYFDNLSYSRIYISDFETSSLFITPTLDDILSEKLFYYAKYFKFKKLLDKNEPVIDSKYSNLTKEDCDYLLFKFKRAILKLVEAIVKRDYTEVVDFERTNTSRLILRGFIGNFEDYTNDEKEDIIINIFP
jgi:hypothetical protein